MNGTTVKVSYTGCANAATEMARTSYPQPQSLLGGILTNVGPILSDMICFEGGKGFTSSIAC